jgi:hypothetical protein
MKTIAAGWGYLNGEDPLAWQADSVAMSPGEPVCSASTDGDAVRRRRLPASSASG